MKLSQCNIGQIVRERKYDPEQNSEQQIGHITGLAFAPGTKEVIPIVKFLSWPEPYPIHHGNLELIDND